jgi:hypothetical protein
MMSIWSVASSRNPLRTQNMESILFFIPGRIQEPTNLSKVGHPIVSELMGLEATQPAYVTNMMDGWLSDVVISRVYRN